eukprot:1652667-Pyramimonas_sp.AAC.1
MAAMPTVRPPTALGEERKSMWDSLIRAKQRAFNELIEAKEAALKEAEVRETKTIRIRDFHCNSATVAATVAVAATVSPVYRSTGD